MHFLYTALGAFYGNLGTNMEDAQIDDNTWSNIFSETQEVE